MSTFHPQNKILGLMLPEDRPLRVRQITKGLYVVDDDPYTSRYSYFESSRPHAPLSGGGDDATWPDPTGNAAR